MGGREFNCTICRFCRTQVFEFSGIDFLATKEEALYEIYSSPTIQASVVSDLVGYFEKSTCNRHYALSYPLQNQVDKVYKKFTMQQEGRLPMFLVIEESSQFSPTEMVSGECYILDEVIVRDGQKEPMLIDGREGEQFVIACKSSDGVWPEPPNNQPLTNMILAGIRAGQQVSAPIRKCLSDACLVTDDDRYVMMVDPSISTKGELVLVTPMDVSAYRQRMSEIREAITAMELDMGIDHIKGLFNAMCKDEHRDDSYHRIQYLQLWQSLCEAGKKPLNYGGKSIRHDKKIIAGSKTLNDITDYRNKIAHGWMHTFDNSYLVNLQRTVNELIRRKYF